GIWELGAGGLCAWLALYFLGQAVAPEKSTFKFVVDVGFLPWFLLAGWVLPKIVRRLKQNLTYRRTGFVSYCRPEKKARTRKALISGIAAGLASFGFVYLLTHQPVGFDPLPIVCGLAFCIVFLVLSFRTGAWRLVLVAAAVAASGTALSLWGWGDKINLIAFYAFTAAALFVSGGVTLALYVRRNPIQSGEEE
ncbi:MAG: hypothetical protein ABSA30_06115, partial [Candidatus Aminicenantales bacterium]